MICNIQLVTTTPVKSHVTIGGKTPMIKQRPRFLRRSSNRVSFSGVLRPSDA